MLLSTLILLLVLCSAAMTEKQDTDTGPNISVGVKFPNVKDRYLTFDKSMLKDDSRQKRVFPPFFQAWKALIKTTFGFRTVGVAGPLKAKVYVKVGTMDTAVTDFHSLAPTTVFRTPDGSMTGFGSDKHVIVLHNSPNGLVMMVADADNPKLGTRMIHYYDNLADAMTQLLALKDETLPQRYLHK